MNSLEEIAIRIKNYLQKESQAGFSAWGTGFDDKKNLVKTKVGESGCTSDTCNHCSHDPLGDDCRFTPKKESDVLSYAGNEDDESGGTDYWILSNAKGHPYRAYCVEHDGPYYDRVFLIQFAEIPDYLLAGIANYRSLD